MDVHPGDTIEVNSKQVGGEVRRGRVIELVSEQPFELRVEWADGHESTLYPAGGMVRVVERSSSS